MNTASYLDFVFKGAKEHSALVMNPWVHTNLITLLQLAHPTMHNINSEFYSAQEKNNNQNLLRLDLSFWSFRT